jgi:hypothetical protein
MMMIKMGLETTLWIVLRFAGLPVQPAYQQFGCRAAAKQTQKISGNPDWQ